MKNGYPDRREDGLFTAGMVTSSGIDVPNGLARPSTENIERLQQVRFVVGSVGFEPGLVVVARKFLEEDERLW